MNVQIQYRNVKYGDRSELTVNGPCTVIPSKQRPDRRKKLTQPFELGASSILVSLFIALLLNSSQLVPPVAR